MEVVAALIRKADS
jgi:hypothetical protein